MQVHVALLLVVLVVSGCGSQSSRVFNAAAPVSSDVTVWYPVGDVNNFKGPIGLKGLKGRDGSVAWVAATGEYTTPALGFPVQIGDVIYTEGNLLQSGPDRLYAVRATDGHILWQEPLPLQDASNPANFTIAADSTTVLFGDTQSGLYAVDTATGMVRWHVDEPFVGTFIRQIAVGGGVAVALVPGTKDGSARLAVFRENDGKLLWYGPEYQSSAGLSLGVNSRAVYIVSDEATRLSSPELIAYNSGTGDELWHYVIAGGIVAVTDQTVLLGSAYIDNGKSDNIACVDAVTGALRWEAHGNYNQWYELSPSPTAVYVPTTTNPTELAAISMASGAQLWRIEVGNYLPGEVMQEDGVAFAFLEGSQNFFGPSTPNRLVALDAQSGRVYWERDIPDKNS